ncbi:MAG: hypothetical protein AAGB48_07620 [Planctomycetota bacterium]
MKVATAATAAAVCPRCRYDRSGIEPDDPCPECGTLPDVAHEASRLVHAPAPFARRLGLGSTIALACIPARVISLTAALGVWLIDSRAGVVATAIAAGAVSAAAGLAWWLLTTPDPAYQRVLPFRKVRVVLRTVAGMQIAVGLVAPFGLLLPRANLAWPGEAWSVWVELAVLGTLWPALALLGVAYTRELARKADDPSLAVSAAGLLKYTWIASLTLSAGLVGGLLTAIMPIVFVVTVPLAVPYAFFLCLLLLIGLGVGARLVYRLQRALALARSAGAGTLTP